MDADTPADGMVTGEEEERLLRSEDTHGGIEVDDLTDLRSQDLERKLVRKLDRRILPVLCLLYLFAYLDRTNLGNARLQGLPEDILGGDPTGSLFAWVNSAFFFSYILLHVPVTLTSKYFRARWWIGGAAVGWGLCSTSMAAANGFRTLLVARLLLGSFEAAFGPAVPLYMSLFYTKRELGLRAGYWFGFAAVAGTFGGLFAYVIQKFPLSSKPNDSWRYLFLVEGIPSILMGVFTIFYLPDRPDDERSKRSNLFTTRERALAVSRMDRGTGADHSHYGVKREHVYAALKDWRVYAGGVVYFALNVALAGMSAFLPTIIHTFGNSTALTQLLTIPPYTIAAISLLSSAYFSDKMQLRGPFIASSLAVSAFGYLVLLFVAPEYAGIRYFGITCIVGGTYPAIGLMLAWYAHNLGSETKKAAGMPMFMAIGQFGSILGSHIFPLSEGPRYFTGFVVGGFLQLLAIGSVVLLYRSYKLDNTARDERYGMVNPNAAVDTSELADKAPEFRYIP